MRVATLILTVVSASSGWAQQQVDLRTQTKNVDFSQASETRPVKSGTLLPTLCQVGDLYFKTDAAPSANLYGCTASNSWTQLTGLAGSGPSAFQPFITDAKASNTSAVVTVPGGVFRSNNVVTSLTTAATMQANMGSLALGAQIWIEFDPPTQARVVVSNANVTQANLSVTNATLGSSTASGFTSGRIPIASCTGGATADTWTTCTDARTPFSLLRIAAGPGISISQGDSSGTQQVSSTLPNPQTYRTLTSGSASCPSAEATLSSYQFPVSASVAAGDSIDITVWFKKTGMSTPAIAVRVDGTYANSPSTLGNLVMNSPVYAVEARGLVLSSSSIVYSVTARNDNAMSVLNGTAVITGATLTSTPLVEFRASGCSGSDTVQVLGAVITLSKGANL